MALEGLAHDAQMLRLGATTAADDPRPRIQRKARVLRHQLGSSVEADLAVAQLRNAAVRLADENRAGLRVRGEIEGAGHELGGSGTAVTAARPPGSLAVQTGERVP